MGGLKVIPRLPDPSYIWEMLHVDTGKVFLHFDVSGAIYLWAEAHISLPLSRENRYQDILDDYCTNVMLFKSVFALVRGNKTTKCL